MTVLKCPEPEEAEDDLISCTYWWLGDVLELFNQVGTMPSRHTSSALLTSSLKTSSSSPRLGDIRHKFVFYRTHLLDIFKTRKVIPLLRKMLGPVKGAWLRFPSPSPNAPLKLRWLRSWWHVLTSQVSIKKPKPSKKKLANYFPQQRTLFR